MKKSFFMAHWLVKSEPSVYSFDQLIKDKSTVWSGVRNYAARLHLRGMKKGDEVFYYHSNEGTDIVGIAKVIKEAYQDPTTDDDRWVAVDLAPVRRLKNPVSLDQIKADKRLTEMALVRIGRLSVQPVADREWKIVLEKAGVK
jgi:predicted RNA-binding protein with PUA-like domain